MPEKTLLAFGDHGEVTGLLTPDTAEAERVIARFATAGVDVDAIAERLQVEAAQAFERSWDELLVNIKTKSATLAAVR